MTSDPGQFGAFSNTSQCFLLQRLSRRNNGLLHCAVGLSFRHVRPFTESHRRHFRVKISSIQLWTTDLIQVAIQWPNLRRSAFHKRRRLGDCVYSFMSKSAEVPQHLTVAMAHFAGEQRRKFPGCETAEIAAALQRQMDRNWQCRNTVDV